jgi:hypothetical protein
MMYQKLSNNLMTGAEAQCIKRLSDNAFIPFDPANTDFQEYQRWLESGNVPLEASTEVSVPADTPTE